MLYLTGFGSAPAQSRQGQYRPRKPEGSRTPAPATKARTTALNGLLVRLSYSASWYRQISTPRGAPRCFELPEFA
jgi:hypothetical protein